MKRVMILLFGLVYMLLVITTPVSAAVPAEYTNDNFFTSEHDAPVSFVQDALGNFSGATETGKSFHQRAVVSDIAVHLHSFTIDQAHFYISGLGIIMAENDTAALSIYLARAGWEEVV